jgi:putative FmdB family regulatory protein
MPTYEYLCDTCTNEFEIVCPMSAHMTRTRCPKCGAEAQQTFKKVVTFDDHPVWLNDNIRAQIQDDDRRPIETRSDYVRHCKERGIVVTDRRV